MRINASFPVLFADSSERVVEATGYFFKDDETTNYFLDDVVINSPHGVELHGDEWSQIDEGLWEAFNEYLAGVF